MSLRCRAGTHLKSTAQQTAGQIRDGPMDEPIKTITVTQAKEKLADGDAVFIDIRDPRAYATAHVPGATQISDTNVEAFVASTDKSMTYIVYCYHGITSQGGAAFFQERGFEDVYSMEGGFCAWEA